MSTVQASPPITTTPPPVAQDSSPGAEAAQQLASRFGRVRVWFEESPIGAAAGLALALVLLGILWIVTWAMIKGEQPTPMITLQPVATDEGADIPLPQEDAGIAVEKLAANTPKPAEPEQTPELEMPKIQKAPTTIEPEKLLGNQGDLKEELDRQKAQFNELDKLFREALSKNQGDSSGAEGKGELDPNSTPGRQARWVITYPSLPQADYARMLDAFRIEMGFLMADRRTMQYLAGFAGAGKKYTGDVSRENRMFWFWMNENMLRDRDEAIMGAHGLRPSTEVVHLYPKEIEKLLAEREKQYLQKTFRTSDIERIQTTHFKIVQGGPSGWHFEVTAMVLRPQ